MAKSNLSEGGDRGGVETRVFGFVGRDGEFRATYVFGLAEFTNKELQTAREMYMR